MLRVVAVIAGSCSPKLYGDWSGDMVGRRRHRTDSDWPIGVVTTDQGVAVRDARTIRISESASIDLPDQELCSGE